LPLVLASLVLVSLALAPLALASLALALGPSVSLTFAPSSLEPVLLPVLPLVLVVLALVALVVSMPKTPYFLQRQL
jgi:hypothetical protein